MIKQYTSIENTSRASFDVAGHIQPGFQYEIILTDAVEDLLEETEWVHDARSSVVASFSIDVNEPVKRGATIAVILLLLVDSHKLKGTNQMVQFAKITSIIQRYIEEKLMVISYEYHMNILLFEVFACRFFMFDDDVF